MATTQMGTTQEVGREGKHLMLMRAVANLNNSVFELNHFLEELTGKIPLTGRLDAPKTASVPCFAEIYNSIEEQINNNSNAITRIKNELRDILL